MDASTMKIALPSCISQAYSPARRWVTPGFDRDGDPCVVLHFDFGACRLHHYLYFENAPTVKSESTQKFFADLGCKQTPADFDSAIPTVTRLLSSLQAVELEADPVLGGLRISAYRFSDGVC